MFDQATLLTTLKQLSYYDGAIPATDFDEVRTAVRQFQSDTGLATDGIYGARTDAALNQLALKLLPASLAKRYSRFRLTRYYLVDEGDYNGDKTVPMLDAAGRVIGMVSPKFFLHAALEGTGRLVDGRLINVTGVHLPVAASDYQAVLDYAQQVLPVHVQEAGIDLSVDQQTVVRAATFEIVADIGVGFGTAHGRPLVPFRSLAADIGAYKTSDPRFHGKGGLVPVGTRVFIPEFAGRAFPNGKPHDGWCVAHDTGGAINGAHFDVFCGTEEMARKASIPSIGHVWFQLLDALGNVIDTVEVRVPFGYTDGLVAR